MQITLVISRHTNIKWKILFMEFLDLFVPSKNHFRKKWKKKLMQKNSIIFAFTKKNWRKKHTRFSIQKGKRKKFLFVSLFKILFKLRDKKEAKNKKYESKNPVTPPLISYIFLLFLTITFLKRNMKEQVQTVSFLLGDG